jgi:uncharacterized protein
MIRKATRSIGKTSHFHVMVKPIGAICNLGCTYCYYLEKEHLYPEGEQFRMPWKVLKSFIRRYSAAHKHLPEIHFAWQGGEPTLLGLDFFERAVALQRKYQPAACRITNSIQTNGVLLDDAWGRFLKEQGFLVGISLDGSPDLHDRYRVDKGGQPTFDRVARGLEILQRHKVEYNVLTCVHRHNGDHPLEVYRFLKSLGARFIQFIPIVGRASPTLEAAMPTSVGAEQYGRFLTSVFDEWLCNDVGQVFVQIFDVALGIWALGQASLCVFDETCGRALALEHNGDLFSCDHFVTPEHRLGNLMDVPLVKMVDSPRQQRFGQAKRDALPAYCKTCDIRFACNGGCPKNRFALTPEGEPGLNYLCAGYQHFFHHIAPVMERMVAALRAGKPAASVVPSLKRGRRRSPQLRPEVHTNKD